MNGLKVFLCLIVVFLAIASSCARTQARENPGKVPKKWQTAKEQNINVAGKESAGQARPPTGNEETTTQKPVAGESAHSGGEDNSAQHGRSEEEPVESPKTEKADGKSDDAYGVGSLCGYCGYCKFCSLCDKDCPCETSKKKPNCHLCKYCKYCSLCAVCDTICTPGGFVDVFTSSIYSSLPSLDKDTKEKVDKDIENARDFIKEYL